MTMGKRGDLIGLRLELDEAITYGTQREAMRLAKEGLRKAQEKSCREKSNILKGR